MTDLGTRLVELADALDLDDADIVDEVLRRVHEPAVVRARPRRLILVAAALVTVVTGAVVHQGSRGALARWFGLDGVRIERIDDLELPAGRPRIDLPGPGESEVVVVDGRELLVSTIDGRIDGLIRKNVGPGSTIVEVDVDGRPGLWIGGAPHEVLYEDAGGAIAVERVAGRTLLWQDGDLLHRVEGFDDLDSALAFATSGT
jgi:hypothetical protein